MKIEKLNDNQIRCTLTKQDLSDRELRISELAYGSDKAKALFSELVMMASYECDFETDNSPLMIEAIPSSKDTLTLTFTKLDHSNDVDTNLANMAEYSDDYPENEINYRENYDDELIDEMLNESDEDDNKALSTGNDLPSPKEIWESIGALKEFLSKPGNNSDTSSAKKAEKNNTEKKAVRPILEKCFVFDSITAVAELAKAISKIYHGNNTLYRSEYDNKYYLVISVSKHTREEFKTVCTVCSEFGTPVPPRYSSSSYYEEFFKPIIKNNAVQKLMLPDMR